MTTDTESAPSTALTRVAIDSEHALFTTTDGAPLARDTDLATWAGLSQARDIRRSIRACVEDGGLETTASSSGGSARAAGPAAIEVTEVVARGTRGASQETTVYYLNEAGALMVASRLRTERAVRLTRAVVATFVAVRRGTLPAPVAAPPPASGDQLGRVLGAIESLVGLVGALVSRTMIAAPPPAPVVPSPAPPPPATAPSAPPEVKAAPVPAALPARRLSETTEWLSPSRIAARASYALQRRVSANLVGRTISALGYRDRDEHYVVELVERAHADGEAAGYRWSPTVQDAVIQHLRTTLADGPGLRRTTPADRNRAGAQQVLRAIVDSTPHHA